MRYWLIVFSFFVAVSACAKEAPESADTHAHTHAHAHAKASVAKEAPEKKARVSMVEKYVQGQHYVALGSPVPTIVKKDKVEITEIFRFGCPACYRFESAVEKWKSSAPAAAEFIKNPVIWDPSTTTRAKVYFTGKQLGLEKETAMAIFKGIHEAKSAREGQKSLLKEKDIIAMFVGLGADAEKAKKMFDSFAIESKVRQADVRARSFKINGTPEIFVDGRFRVTTESAGSFDNMLQVASFLVDKVAIERGIKK